MIKRIVNKGRSRAEPATTSLTLLEWARAEKPEAWERLVRVYAPAIYRWCRMDGISPEDARDMTQETLLKVVEKLDDFKKENPEDTFRGWLRRIARNKALDHWRRVARHRGVPVGGGSMQEWRLSQTAAESTSSGEPVDPRLAVFSEIVERVRERCGEKSWAIFTHYVTDGFTAEETSREFGVSEAYVYQVRARMLHRFRDEYAKEERRPYLEEKADLQEKPRDVP